MWSTDERSFLENMDVHLHFPAGAVGKDGPSAGVAIVVALVSLFANTVVKKSKRSDGGRNLEERTDNHSLMSSRVQVWP